MIAIKGTSLQTVAREPVAEVRQNKEMEMLVIGRRRQAIGILTSLRHGNIL